MNLKEGFQIFDPPVFIPWDISESKLKTIVPEDALNYVTRGYYTVKCEPLPGVKCHLGFHFRNSSKLNELQFFRTAYPDLTASFTEFQSAAEAAFGKPTHSTQGSDGFLDHEWRIPGAKVYHYIFDRFGLEEHMKIVRH